jgi:formyltetrahydrofolate-dependent phosphoribosylglycinamide formyltransferase
VSGSGRTLENLLRLQRDGNTAYTITCVIASRPDCRGADLARQAGLPLFCHRFPSSTDPQLEGELTAFLRQNAVDWIVLAGFLRPLPVLSPWRDRIVNIHPALLPKFGGKGMYGMNVHRAVIAAGESESGATVHFVNEHYDEGAVIAQIKVPVQTGDSPEDLAARVFAAETKLYPDVINKLISGQLPLNDRTTYVTEAD